LPGNIDAPALDRFPVLRDVRGVDHLFTTRLTPQAPARYAPDADHATLGLRASTWRFAEQTHGCGVARVNGESPRVTPGVDALCTNEPGLALGIYVADCGAVFLADPAHHAIGLAHSGRKGTELNILSALVRTMEKEFGTRPEDLVGQLSPCIRPPHYESDFAATLRAQARDLGIGTFADAGCDTAANLDRYFSYRAEKGHTGRMLAGLVLLPRLSA
jgi:copper oxidase (laccase) domain-containing protein